jgi:hypothetical protein
MPEYHIYCIDDANRVVSRRNHDAPDDLAALEKGRELCGVREVEAWQRTRLVARLAKDRTASREPDTGSRNSR